MNKNFISLFKKHQFENLQLYKEEDFSISGACNTYSKAFAVADIIRCREKTGPIVWCVDNIHQVNNLKKALELWVPYSIDTYILDENKLNDFKVNRLNNLKTVKFLEQLKMPINTFIITRYSDLLKGCPNYHFYNSHLLNFKVGDEINFIDFFSNLINLGYEVSKDNYLEKGCYIRKGDVLNIFLPHFSNPIKVELSFDKIEKIYFYEQLSMRKIQDIDTLSIPLINLEFNSFNIFKFLNNGLFIKDELEVADDLYDDFDLILKSNKNNRTISFSVFPENEEAHTHLSFLNIIKYTDFLDFTSSIKDRVRDDWKVFVFTKSLDLIEGAFKEKNISYKIGFEEAKLGEGEIVLFPLKKEDVFPENFMNNNLKLLFITDKDIHLSYKHEKVATSNQVFQDFLMSLKIDDYVVHEDHGISRFESLDKREIDGVMHEYLKLAYAENDKLFVPIDQAYKVNKYIGADGYMPKLTRLGSSEWVTINRKVREDVQELAKDLLELYAKRKLAKGFKFGSDSLEQKKFEENFEYLPTPGQIKAFEDVKKDMEQIKPMDRLICGDVGFGKTEVAMRASFKAVKGGKQVALISPITILTDQHHRSFIKRMADFNIRIEMLSRFRTPAQQKEILNKLEKGEIDIIIGTHRLLQSDVAFKNLGLLIIDEEQRFGVKQKEKLKKIRSEIDILTLTATPIPRTLNICLNKLRDITTITTPPPGRLPVVTEVRRYSESLVRKAIMHEIDRGGQVYFLHNRVQTIDSVAVKLKSLIPEADFVVAHGKLTPDDLSKRIIDFKNGKYNVLVSSTIIENGIDLPNANTLIVNNADNFGLAQLYQLRGRVGRGKTQAHAFLLYSGQHLKLDAKKRLRAIVEASKPGSGFQIAMHDLEIRGAGDVLGANQHGTVNSVGVSHFIRMLNKTVEDMKTGRIKEDGSVAESIETSVDLPFTAYIPDHYIVNSKEKIYLYQKLSGADNLNYLKELKEDAITEYGKMPIEVVNLFKVLEIKILAKKANLLSVKSATVSGTNEKQIVLNLSNLIKPEHIMSLLEYNHNWTISGHKLTIPMKSFGLNWFDELREGVVRLSKKHDPLKVVKKGK